MLIWCTSVHIDAYMCTLMHIWCTSVCTDLHQCALTCISLHWLASVCTDLHQSALTCISLHWCTWVRGPLSRHGISESIEPGSLVIGIDVKHPPPARILCEYVANQRTDGRGYIPKRGPHAWLGIFLWCTNEGVRLREVEGMVLGGCRIAEGRQGQKCNLTRLCTTGFHLPLETPGTFRKAHLVSSSLFGNPSHFSSLLLGFIILQPSDSNSWFVLDSQQLVSSIIQ